MSKNYFINHNVLLSARGELIGYEMEVTKRKAKREGFMQIAVESNDKQEYIRFYDMLKAFRIGPDVSLVEKSPVEIIYHLRGKTRPVRRTDDWKKEIGNYRVNAWGEQV